MCLGWSRGWVGLKSRLTAGPGFWTRYVHHLSDRSTTFSAPKNPEDPTPRTIEEAFVMKMAQLGQDTSTDPITKSESKTTDSSRVPVSIQREVASLEPRFRITFDRGAPPAAETGLTKADTARVIQVVCDLVDRKLPPVPALRLQIPNDYPVSSPKYDYELVDYCKYFGSLD